MFDSFIIKHPQTPPSWLADWPSPDQIDQQFPKALRSLGCYFAHKLTEASLEWNDTLIRARMGVQMCTWTKTPSGRWLKHCTCGAPEGRCPHVYITCLLLYKVFIQEKWLEPTGNMPAQLNCRSTRAARTYRPLPQQQDFPSPPTQPRTQMFTPATETCSHKLVVEVDFKHEPGQATLRLYDKPVTQAEPLRLNAIYNLGFRIKRDDLLPGWQKEDKDFLLWMFPAVAKIPWRSRNFTVLKIPRKTFAEWQEHWKNCPERFIERHSQQFLQLSNITTPVNLTVELALEGDFVRLNANFVLPGNISMPVHEFFQRLEGNPEKDELLHKIKQYQPPIPWTILSQHFSKHPPRLKRSLIPLHLGDLLNGRLDVVRGDCVTVNDTAQVTPELFAATAENQFVIEARIDGVPLPIDSNIIPQASIRDNGKGFVVTLPGNEAAGKLRQLLSAIDIPGMKRNGARISFPQSRQNAMMFRVFWSTLPKTIATQAAPSVVNLLTSAHGLAIQAVITTREEGPLALLDLQWDVDGQQLSHQELMRIARSNQPLFRSQSGSWLDISQEDAQKALESLGNIDLIPGKDNPILKARATSQIQKLQKNLGASLAPSTHQFLQRIAQEPPPQVPEPDSQLVRVLRSYQLQGTQFLIDRTACGAGPILADDMGLGKTVQVLATLDAWRRQAQAEGQTFQALVVCPASVMSVWQRQAQMFTPELTVRLLRGTPSQRRELIFHASENLLVTHYQLARIDGEDLQTRTFDFMVLDEAQAVKNPEAQVTQAIAALKVKHALALTGTPLENAITDLWSIMNCINPGFLGPLNSFIIRYGSSNDGLSRLNRKIKPLLLRRTKQMVDLELPPKTEQTITVEMTPEQRELYVRELAIGKLKLKEHGPGAILGVLTRLRQICCHPDLATHQAGSCESAKLQRLLEQLSTLNGSGHSSLVFSQFTSMLDIIARELDSLHIPYLMLTGATSLAQREELVKQFQKSTVPTVFLLSLKAAGTGLTLTRADYVFLFDPWWNPAVEQQAIDRTHRIGQTNPVVAYRFIAAESVEEKVAALLEQKRELFNAVLQDDEDGNTLPPTRLTYEELKALID